MVIMFLVASDHILLHTASSAHTRLKQQKPFTKMSIFPRFVWATDLVLSRRGVNWSWQVPYLRTSYISRGGFLMKKSILLLAIVGVSRISDLLLQDNLAFQGKASVRSDGCIKQAFNVMLFWWTIASSQLFNYTLFAILLVSLGVYDPYDWPSLDGRWSNAKTVRRFWG
jgi:hypothetical protein